MKNRLLAILLYLEIGFRFIKNLILNKLWVEDLGFNYDDVLYFNNTYCKIVPTFNNVLFYEINGHKFYTKESFYLNRNLLESYTFKIFGIKNVIEHKIDFKTLEQQHIMNAKFFKNDSESISLNTAIIFYPFSVSILNKKYKILNGTNFIKQRTKLDSSAKIKNHQIQINQSKFKIDQFL